MFLPDQDRNMTVADIISRAVPSAAAVSEVRVVPSPRRHKHYEARLSDGSVLLLRLPPPSMVKLLRSEKAASVGAEAAVLAWVASLGDDIDCRGDMTASGAPRHGNLQPAPGRQHLLGSNSSTEAPRSRSSSQAAVARPDIALAPALAAHSPAHTIVSPEFNVVRPTRGTAVASLSPPLAAEERAAVDFQSGRLLRRLAGMRSPSGRFGPALVVIGGRVTPPPSKKSEDASTGGLEPAGVWEPAGYSTWVAAFTSLLEGVLRDGEDMHVTLPYSSIRQHLWRLRHLLGEVNNACLVVVDSGEDENVLVVRRALSKSTVSKGAMKRLGRKSSDDGDLDKRKKKKNDHGKDPEGKGKSEEEKEKKRSGHATSKHGDTNKEISGSGTTHAGTQNAEEIVVTGVRDWGNCIFGDPLFATAFHRNASDNLWSGFTNPPPEDPGPDPVEDWAHARTRMLLYECYHAVTRVVREFYRPGKDSNRRELAARKALNGVMARLDRVPGGSAGRRRPSGELSPAKRQKTDDENEGDDDVFEGDDD